MSEKDLSRFIKIDSRVEEPNYVQIKNNLQKEVQQKERLLQVYSGIEIDGNNKDSNSFQIGVGGQAIISREIPANKKATIVVKIVIE